MKEIRPSKRAFMIALGVLTVVLLAFGLLRMKFGQFLPASIDKNLPDVVMFGAVGIMLWNKKLRNDEEKAEKERKRQEEEALAAKPVSGDADDEALADAGGEGSTDVASDEASTSPAGDPNRDAG
jgi:hypothetical protein